MDKDLTFIVSEIAGHRKTLLPSHSSMAPVLMSPYAAWSVQQQLWEALEMNSIHAT